MGADENWRLVHCEVGAEAITTQSGILVRAATVSQASDSACGADPAAYQSIGEHCITALPMGGTRLELVTSTMSTWRSNQLS